MSPATNAPADIPGLTDFVLIGRGGFSRVYRAHQARMNRDVAVKVLDLRPDMDTSKVFEKECRAAGGLGSHPNIVTIFDSGIDADGTPWIMMPFYPSGSLDSLVKAGGPLPWRIALEHCRKIGTALAEAHRQGVLHRDIKPENVLLTEFGEPVLADFGIAQVTGATATSSGLSLTLLHAAPEVLEDRNPGPKSDVYSLGSTLYATVAGQPPFFREGESSLGALLLRVLQEPVPDLRPRGLPQNVCAFIETVMSKNPDERPSAAQFATLSQELLTGPADAGRSANRSSASSKTVVLPRSPFGDSPFPPFPPPQPGPGQSAFPAGPVPQSDSAPPPVGFPPPNLPPPNFPAPNYPPVSPPPGASPRTQLVTPGQFRPPGQAIGPPPNYAAGQPAGPGDAPPGRKPSKAIRYVAVGVVVAVIGALIAFLLTRGDSGPTTDTTAVSDSAASDTRVDNSTVGGSGADTSSADSSAAPESTVADTAASDSSLGSSGDLGTAALNDGPGTVDGLFAERIQVPPVAVFKVDNASVPGYSLAADGSRVAFVDASDTKNVTLHTIDFATGTTETLASGLVTPVVAIATSTTAVAYIALDKTAATPDTYAVFVARIGETTPTKLAAAYGTGLSFVNGGDTLILVGTRDDGKSGLWTIDPSSGAVVSIAATASTSWDGSGTKIVYTTGEEPSVSLIEYDVVTGATETIAEGLAGVQTLDLLPSGEVLYGTDNPLTLRAILPTGYGGTRASVDYASDAAGRLGLRLPGRRYTFFEKDRVGIRGVESGDTVWVTPEGATAVDYTVSDDGGRIVASTVDGELWTVAIA